ncbi:MAG: 7-carboxy-7-deazaguanine synthase [Alphaproteobacteria bacterium]|nr:7-carboxy-7-deazaguanine synthase [Alphaproteobacteria bacterium]
MTYAVKELFHTLQGEGAHTGRAAVFCRFAGCNLWSGRAGDRDAAICRFCDTDFIGGETFATAGTLAAAIAALWLGGREATPFVVVTGGEPLLQLDPPLIAALHEQGFTIAVETNGTMAPPPGIDWLCVSPKAGAPLRVTGGDELKLVFPQAGLDPEAFAGLDFRYFFVQPMDGPAREATTREAIGYCLEHPRWRLSLQMHKYLGIP